MLVTTTDTHKSTEGSADVPTTGVSTGMSVPNTADISTITSARINSDVPTSAEAPLSVGTSSSTVAPTTTDGLSSTNFLTPGIEQYLNHFRKIVSPLYPSLVSDRL